MVEANRAELETWLVREGGAVAGKAAFEVDLVLGELWEAAALPTNRELRIAVDVPIDQLLDEYRAGCDLHRELVASLDLDTESRGVLSWRSEPVALRWILFHLIEETSRHNGHLDILRELADKVTGT
ncbi:MAG TPA: DUF664 domain-containing protein [Pseudonocardiaceae bacterium]